MKKFDRVIFISILLLLFCSSCGNFQKKKQSVEEQLEDLSISTYQINSSVPNVIKGKQGSVICIPANSFKNTVGMVDIELREFYSTASMMAAKLSTTSNGRFLESAGMLHISASTEGQSIELNDSAYVLVLFKKELRLENNYGLFYGVEIENRYVNWIPAPVDRQIIADSIRYVKQNEVYEYNSNSIFEAQRYGANDEPKGPPESGRLRFLNGYSIEGYNDRIIDSLLTYKEKEYFYNKRFREHRRGLYIKLDSTGKITNVTEGSFVDCIDEDTIRSIVDKLIKHTKELQPIDVSSFNLRADEELLVKFNFLFLRRFLAEEYLKRMYFTEFSELDIELDRYIVFRAMNLNWINCDRFYNSIKPRIAFTVQCADSVTNCEVSLVFKDAKTVLNAEKNGEKYLFKGVPLGQKVKVVGMAFDEDNIFSYTIQDISVSDSTIFLNNFHSGSLSRLEKELMR